MSKRATLAPSALRLRSPEELLQELRQRLQDEFSLGMLGMFSLIVEGWTDVGYVELAVRKYHERYGVDLLAIPEQMASVDDARIGLFTPGQPGNPRRGGVPQMVRLAAILKPYVFTIQAFRGLMFVFDHDDAGIEASTKISTDGYARNVNFTTLDPKLHPKSCAKKQVCIEDLLSLRIQERFFDSTPATCAVDYVDGVRTRFQWGRDSKPALRDFVVREAELEDVHEIVQLVKRVREGFAIPD